MTDDDIARIADAVWDRLLPGRGWPDAPAQDWLVDARINSVAAPAATDVAAATWAHVLPGRGWPDAPAQDYVVDTRIDVAK